MIRVIYLSRDDVAALDAGRHVEALATAGDSGTSVVIGLEGGLFPAHAGGAGPIPIALVPGQLTDLVQNGTVSGGSWLYQLDYQLVLKA